MRWRVILFVLVLFAVAVAEGHGLAAWGAVAIGGGVYLILFLPILGKRGPR